MERLLCLAIGYCCGIFQTAYIYGRTKGIDIREKGSGNAGTTNTMRVFGTKAGVMVLLVDILKCVIACSVARFVIGPMYPEEKSLLIMYAAAGVILGHDFPLYLKFRGGKGIAATAGLICSFHWTFFVAGVIVFFGTFFITHYVSLGSLLVYAVFLAQIIIEGQLGFFDMEQCYLNEMYIVTALLMLLAYVKHRSNIGRLIRGEEHKTFLSKKGKESQKQ